LIQKNQ